MPDRVFLKRMEEFLVPVVPRNDGIARTERTQSEVAVAKGVYYLRESWAMVVLRADR